MSIIPLIFKLHWGVEGKRFMSPFGIVKPFRALSVLPCKFELAVSNLVLFGELRKFFIVVLHATFRMKNQSLLYLSFLLAIEWWSAGKVVCSVNIRPETGRPGIRLKWLSATKVI